MAKVCGFPLTFRISDAPTATSGCSSFIAMSGKASFVIRYRQMLMITPALGVFTKELRKCVPNNPSQNDTDRNNDH